jgi:DNA-binding transcriptional MerR regulator
MTIAELETRPLYGIGTVARLTRIRPETLRIWERRYGLGASQKAANGRRLYTQTELEHLQIVVRLVEQGFRIGEIAAMERKTLEAMAEQVGSAAAELERKSRVLFIGYQLCSWLDEHPGCLYGLDSRLLRSGLDDLPELTVDELGDIDLLVVECGALNAEQVERLGALKRELKVQSVLVFYEFSNPRWLSELDQAGIGSTKLPLDTAMFGEQMKRLQSGLEVERGVADAGELAVPRGRLFSDTELANYRKVESMLACGCTQHLSEIIQSLSNFEQYSTKCAVESWSDAATHSCVYAYTNQARWLMERAMQAVLEEHSEGD